MVTFQTLTGEQIIIDLPSFQKAYEKAISEKSETFEYKGQEFLTDYAKYVIEYLKSRK